MRWSSSTGLALAAAAVTGFALPPDTTTQGEQYQLTGNAVAIYNVAGTVTVEGADTDDVVVTLARHGADAARLDVAQGEIDDRATLRVLYPADDIVYPGGGQTELRIRSDGTFGDSRGDRGRRVRIRESGDGLRASADLHVRVPAGVDVALYLAVGRVTVSNVSGDLRIDTHSAAVETAGTAGMLLVDVGSGAVSVRDATGETTIDTGSGSVDAAGVRGAFLRIDTGSGGVTVADVTVTTLGIDTGSGGVAAGSTAAEEILVDTGSGSVELRLTAHPQRVEIDTGSGSVTLSVPGDFAADVELDTGSGAIELDFPLTTRHFSRDHVQGTIGGGGAKVAIDTGSGNITIRRAT